MRVRPVPGTVRVRFGDRLLASSAAALRVIEVGKDVHHPAIYLPPADIVAKLARNTHETHCPLKGRAGYFDLPASAGQPAITSIAWTYIEPPAFSAELAGLVSFYPRHVVIEEHPAGEGD